MYSSTESYPRRQGVRSSGSICLRLISLSLGCLTTMSPTRKGCAGTFENVFKILFRSSTISSAILLKWNVTLLVFMPLYSELCLSLCCSSPTVRPYGLLTSHTLEGARSPRHIIEVLIICLLQFFLNLLIYYSVCFILNRIFISTNTVRTEVAKTAKSEFHCIFVCYFVVPSAAVGKYKERSLTAKTQLTKPTNH